MVHREDLEDQPKAPAEPAKYGLVASSIVATLMDLDEEVSIGAAKLKPKVADRVGFKITERIWKDALRDLAPYREDPEGPAGEPDGGLGASSGQTLRSR